MAGVAGVDAAVDLPSTPGTYALVLRNTGSKTVRVGAIGDVDLKPGFVIYVGSAFGPGGLRARVTRHARLTEKKHRWHIDYLRPHMTLEAAWWTAAPDHREHTWASALNRYMAPAHRRFGASDCNCETHLYFSADRPDHRPLGRVTIWRPQ